MNIPQKYVPTYLSKKDQAKAIKELRRSRKAYKKQRYYTRKKVKSFKNRKSSHVMRAKDMYGVDNLNNLNKLSKKTKCSQDGLRDIMRKGEGAYFSSGSRPNQTPQSWGVARLGSAITGGKSSIVDYHILKKECKKTSKARRLAEKMIKKHGKTVKNRKKIKV